MLQANNPQGIYSRKRKNYFDITTGQGKQDCKKMILNQTNNLSDVTQTIGLKLRGYSYRSGQQAKSSYHKNNRFK